MHHDYRVEKARRFLEAAHLAYEHGHYETTVSRAYYAAYHQVAWVLMEWKSVDRRRWDHTQLHKEFLDNFCKIGYLFTAADGVDYGDLFEERIKADYLDVRFNERHVARLLVKADALCSKILRVGP